jgi:hypothetical protein
MKQTHSTYPVYNSFEDACRYGKYYKAVGEITVFHDGKERRMDIIKPLQGDGNLVYKGTTLVARKATTREVDSVRRWKPYVY